MDASQNRQNNRVKICGKRRLSRPICPDFIEELARLNKMQAFRDRN
jgi:hypothetical protein